MFLLDPDRFHKSLASFCPIAGIDIHVLAVQAFGAVVGVAGAGHFVPAMPANKIFFAFLEKSH